MEHVYLKKALLLSKKHKYKNKKKKNRSYISYTYVPKSSNPEDINLIAYQVFGSLYFSPSED